jgi:tripeptide aminopeptidase
MVAHRFGVSHNAWENQLNQLSPELRPVVKTFGELVRQNSGAVEFKPRYPQTVPEIPRYPLPSTPEQMLLAQDLAKRLQTLGLEVTLDSHYNVIGKLKSNLPESFPRRDSLSTLALTAHLDTTYEQPNQGVIPQLHRHYNGQPITITKKNNKGEPVILDPGQTPALAWRLGYDIITASGDTLLGADAKAGVAEILEALRLLQEHNKAHPENPLYHPHLRILFAVDEETNLMGARTVDLNILGADFAIDLDDTEPGNINVRSYTGHNINVTIKGKIVHASEAAQMKMANPMMLASSLAASLPKNQLLENKQGQMQGYISLDQLNSDLVQAQLLFLARDLKDDAVKKRVATVLNAVEKLKKQLKGNGQYPAKSTPATVTWQVEEEYKNPNIASNSPFVRLLRKSALKTQLDPKITAFRGCTDAAILTERGLPTVNLGCGWQNAHQLTEWTSAQDLYKMSRYLLQIITDWPQNGPQKPSQPAPTVHPIAWPKITQG